jgi:hypothetical protein
MLNNIFSNPILLGFIILSIATIILLVLILIMHMRLRKFLINVNAKNISDSLEIVSKDLNELQKFKSELETYLSDVEKRLRKSVQSVHTVRFNPFKGTGGGGNQSFATAFLNQEGNGVIISSLYSRDYVSVFSKPITKHDSEHELSGEEKEALEKAKKLL